MIPTFRGPRTGGLFGNNLEVDPASQEARLDAWADHDAVIAYTGGFRVVRDLDAQLRRRNPDVLVATYLQGMRRLERPSVYWPRPLQCVELPELPDQGWRGWNAVDLRDQGTVDAMVAAYTDWLTGPIGACRPLFFDELHADVSFERKEITGTAWFEGARRLLRRMGGGIVNGNFGRVTPATPDGSWTPMIYGRMVQNAGDLVGPALLAEARLLAEEAGQTQPHQRHFFIQDTRPENAMKCLVLSCFCDGYYGISRDDFRQDRLIEAPIRRGALGRPLEYAEGRAQKPELWPLAGNDLIGVARRFENGRAWIDTTGRFGVELSS